MQQMPMFRTSPLMTLVPIVINQAFVYSFLGIFNYFRESARQKAEQEGRKGIRATLFDEEAEEAENDISALGISFLLVQSVRYHVGGVLPAMNGLVTVTHNHTYCLYLFGIAVLFLVYSVLFVMVKDKTAENSLARRLCTILTSATGMGMAWCILWGTRSAFADVEPLNRIHEGVTTMMGRLLMSLTLTLGVVLIIFPLDAIDDKLNGGEVKGPGTEVVSSIVEAASVLVGFSWEHSFDGAVESVASVSSNPRVMATVLVIFVFAAIVPPWRKYILKRAMQLRGLKYPEEE